MQEKEYWNIVRGLYQDTELGLIDAISERKLSQLILNSKYKNHSYLMEPNEIEQLNKLPNRLLICRGIGSDVELNCSKYGYGWSWTLDPQVAMWFATRFKCEYQYFLTSYINKEKIIAYWLDKREEEVLINPATLIDEIKIKELH